ncbi:hypothetical protein MP228_000257 [Amoeboaphelidium protococcarum]|nr:hypothetical protein MP228_000257 [Amoeboaphelidium protococcarum]
MPKVCFAGDDIIEFENISNGDSISESPAATLSLPEEQLSNSSPIPDGNVVSAPPLYLQRQSSYDQLVTKTKSKWQRLSQCQRAMIITIPLVILLIILVCIIAYGIAYVMIRNKFNSRNDGQYSSMQLSNVTNSSVEATVVQSQQMRSFVPVYLEDFTIVYSTAYGDFASIKMPGYMVENGILNRSYITPLKITNMDMLGSFGNEVMRILTSQSSDIYNIQIHQRSIMSVHIGYPALSFIRWSIPYYSSFPFRVTSLGNFASLTAKQEIANYTELPDPSASSLAQTADADKPNTLNNTMIEQQNEMSGNASISNVRLRLKNFVFEATVNFTNPIPLALNLQLVKGKVYFVDKPLANVFVQNCTIVSGFNSIRLKLQISSFGGFMGTAASVVFKGLRPEKFTLRDITMIGEGGYIQWLNAWFEGVQVRLPTSPTQKR